MLILKRTCSLLAVILLLSDCLAEAKTDAIKQIILYRVDFDLESMVTIDCNSFLNAFKNLEKVDTIAIRNIRVQKEILSNIGSAASAPKFNGIDTGGKLYIYYVSGKLDVYCFGCTVIFSKNGKCMKLRNRKLINIIEHYKQ